MTKEISCVIEEIHIYKYQIYTLLDTTGNGYQEIETFKKRIRITNEFTQ